MSYGRDGTPGGAPDKGNWGVEGAAKGAKDYTITKILSEADKEAYLKSVNMAEAGKTTPEHPELGIVSMIGRNKGKVSQAMLDQFKGDKGLAERAKEMQEGESIDMNHDKSGEIGGTAGYGVVSGNYKYQGGRKKNTNLTIVGKNAVLTVRIDDRSVHTGGGGVNMKGIKGTVEFSAEESEGKVVKITIPKNDPLLEDIARELQAANHENDLVRIAKKYPQVDIITGTTKGNKDAEKATADLPVAGAGFNASGEFSSTEYSDGSADYTGANDVGGQFSVMGLAMKSNSREELQANVDDKGNVKADLNQTDTGFDLDKTVDQIGKNLKNDPFGMVTGGATNVRESSESSGTFLSNREMDHLLRLAHSKEYDNYFNSPALRLEWAQTVHRIRSAGKDRKAAAKHLAEFVGRKRHGKKEGIESMLEAAGHRNGGARYEFPEGTAALKPTYEWLLRSAPPSQIKELVRTGKPAEAMQLAKDALARIKKVQDGLQAAKDKFKDKSRLADMQIFLASRKAQINGLQLQMQNPTVLPQEVMQTAEKTLFDEAMARVKTYQGQEAQFYSQVVAMMEDGHVSSSETIERAEILKQLDDLYKRWDDDLQQLNHLHGKYGFGGELDLSTMQPNRRKLDLTREGSAPMEVNKSMADAGQKMVDRAMTKIKADQARAKRAKEAEARKKRMAAGQKWISQVQSKLGAVTDAMGMVNGMNLRGQTGSITSGANREWSKGFLMNGKARKALNQLQALTISGSLDEINNAGKKALTLAIASLQAFKKGNQIQQYGG